MHTFRASFGFTPNGSAQTGPRVRNVDPFLFPARVRPMRELVLSLAIHDKNVTISVFHHPERIDASI